MVIGDVGSRDLRDVALRFEQFREVLTRILPDGTKKVFTVDVDSIIRGKKDSKTDDTTLLLQPGQVVPLLKDPDVRRVAWLGPRGRLARLDRSRLPSGEAALTGAAA